MKFRLVDDAASDDARDEIRRRLEIDPPLLAWVARARLLGAVAR